MGRAERKCQALMMISKQSWDDTTDDRAGRAKTKGSDGPSYQRKGGEGGPLALPSPTILRPTAETRPIVEP